MKLEFSEPHRSYDSGSQSARAITELWVEENMYCPNCGNPSLTKFPNNLPVADFFCARCNDQYELKSQKKEFGKKLANGAYDTKMERLSSNTSPNLILLRYDQDKATVKRLIFVPKRFFVPSLVEKRKPLGPLARRAGWIGSNIILERIPLVARIDAVSGGVVRPKESVLAQWQKTAFLDNKEQAAKGWLINVMALVDKLDQAEFTLEEMYRFEADLRKIFPDNKNIRPKIRQQLQVLRDNDYLEFKGNGRYRLINVSS